MKFIEPLGQTGSKQRYDHYTASTMRCGCSNALNFTFVTSACSRPHWLTPRHPCVGVGAYETHVRIAMAALEPVVRNLVLVDRNRRAGWTLLLLVLWINGFQHNFTAEEGFDLMLGVATGTLGPEC